MAKKKIDEGRDRATSLMRVNKRISQAAQGEALALCRRIALFLKDGEQTKERDNEGLGAFVLENDDAVECLHDCIDMAREITGEAPDLV